MASLNEEQRAYFALGSPSSSLGPWGVVVARFSLPDRKQGQGAVLELFDAHCERRVGEHRTIANTTHMRSLDRATWDWFNTRGDLHVRRHITRERTQQVNEAPLSQLLGLAASEASGELVCEAGGVEVHVFLQCGRVAWASDSRYPRAFTE